MKDAEELEKTLRSLLPRLSSEFKVRRIGYFGSFASGNHSPYSDIDILVDFSEPLGWEFFDLKMLLEDKLARNIDLLTENALRNEIKDQVLQQVKYIA